MRRIIIWIFLVGIFPGGMAQEAPSDSSKAVKILGFKFHQGFVLIHSRNLRPVKNSYPRGLELDMVWHYTTRNSWETCHCYPRLGIALTVWDYDNPEILGYGVTGLFFVEPVFGASKKLGFSVRAGLGLSYQSKPYDEESNPDNMSYSTTVAFPLQLGANMHLRLNPNWRLSATAVYNHFSNGGIREPNAGINWPSAAIGADYYLKSAHFKTRVKKNWKEYGAPATRFDITFFMAFKEPESKLYLFSPGIELKISRQVALINALTLGAEWISDNGTRYEIEQAGAHHSHQKVSLAFGHEFILGKFLFSQQFGVYLYKPYRVGADVYQRYGLVFRMNKRFSTGISLKAHGHVADFLDFRIGLSF